MRAMDEQIRVSDTPLKGSFVLSGSSTKPIGAFSSILGGQNATWKVTHRAELAEERLDLVVADLGGEAADEDLAVAGLRLLRIDLLVVDDVLGRRRHLLNGLGRGVHDEREATAAPRLRIGFHIDALDLAVLAKVFAQLLC